MSSINLKPSTKKKKKLQFKNILQKAIHKKYYFWIFENSNNLTNEKSIHFSQVVFCRGSGFDFSRSTRNKREYKGLGWYLAVVLKSIVYFLHDM